MIPSGVFSIQQEYDNKYVFVDLGFIQDLVGKTNQVSGIEIALQDYTKRNLVSAAIQKVLGQEYKIQDRDQQDAAFYKLMQIEKWVSYAILSFVLVLVAFNIVGALWMIVLEKKKDLMVLKSMGMKDHRVKLIVLSTGFIDHRIGDMHRFCTGCYIVFVAAKIWSGTYPRRIFGRQISNRNQMV